METLENQNFVIQPHPDDPTAYPKINGAFAIESLTKICARAYLTISGLPRYLNKDWKVDVSVDVTLKMNLETRLSWIKAFFESRNELSILLDKDYQYGHSVGEGFYPNVKPNLVFSCLGDDPFDGSWQEIKNGDEIYDQLHFCFTHNKQTPTFGSETDVWLECSIPTDIDQDIIRTMESYISPK